MANWSDLLTEWKGYSSEQQAEWLTSRTIKALSDVSNILNNANVVLYFSAFLQKPGHSSAMAGEDVNGLMNAFYEVKPKKSKKSKKPKEDLVVIMHTPGGELSSVESITRYIHNVFKKVTVIVPVRSMSAGAMFCLSCDKIIISRAGQLGPTDPQIIRPAAAYSVKEIISQFNKARADVLENVETARVWSPILKAYGPALQEQAINVERHSKERIGEWLKSKGKSLKDANKIIEFFHDSSRFHGQRIDYQSILDQGLAKPGMLDVQLLEDNQELQNAVMVAYHLATIFAENSSMVKWITSNKGRNWVKTSAIG